MTVTLVDVAAGRELRQLGKGLRGCQQVAFSHDGRLLIAAGDDGRLRVWETATGRPVTPPLSGRLPIQVAAFAPDGRSVVAAGVQSSMHVAYQTWGLSADGLSAAEWARFDALAAPIRTARIPVIPAGRCNQGYERNTNAEDAESTENTERIPYSFLFALSASSASSAFIRDFSIPLCGGGCGA